MNTWKNVKQSKAKKKKIFSTKMFYQKSNTHFMNTSKYAKLTKTKTKAITVTFDEIIRALLKQT